MRVLFVSRWFPYPAINGSKQRVLHLIGALAHQHEVSLVSFADHPTIEPDAPEIRALCGRIIIVPWREYRPRSWRALGAVWGSTPRSIAATYSAEMAEHVRRLAADGTHAAVVASQLTSASYHACWKGTPAVFDEIELGVYDDGIQQAKGAARARRVLTWTKMSRYLERVLDDCVLGTVVSAREGALVRRAAPKAPRIEVVPNGTSVPATVPSALQRRPNALVFAGALTYAANADGMRWFIDQVYPTIRGSCPDTSLTVIGETGGHVWPGDGIVQTGFVTDPRPHVGEAMVSIAPVLWGGGTRLKILEAMAMGTPVVATAKAAEGLELVDREHVLIADAPQSFAQAVLRLFKDTALRQRLADNARRLVSERYEWSGIGRQFVRLVEDAATASSRAVP